VFLLADEEQSIPLTPLVSGQNIVWDGQVIGQEAVKPNAIRLEHVYLDTPANDEPAELNKLIPSDPTNKIYVDAQIVEMIAAHLAEYHSE
jgi:hypothetical protein